MTAHTDPTPDPTTTPTPDKWEVLSGEGLPERFRFSREVYGDVADDATRVLLALTDGGHADQPSDYLRWVSITAAQALAARPTPPVPAAAPDERGLPGVWETWQRPGAHPSVASEYAAMEAGWTAALAARPAPVVSTADVEKAIDAVLATPADPMGDPRETARRDVLAVARALGITVADAPAVDDEGGQER